MHANKSFEWTTEFGKLNSLCYPGQIKAVFFLNCLAGSRAVIKTAALMAGKKSSLNNATVLSGDYKNPNSRDALEDFFTREALPVALGGLLNIGNGPYCIEGVVNNSISSYDTSNNDDEEKIGEQNTKLSISSWKNVEQREVLGVQMLVL